MIKIVLNLFRIRKLKAWRENEFLTLEGILRVEKTQLSRVEEIVKVVTFSFRKESD